MTSADSIIGQKIIRLDEVSSTNNYAANLIAKKNPIEGTVILALKQGSGRGQFDRDWLSEPGKNITMSVIISPGFLPVHKQFMLNILASISVVDVLTSLFSMDVKVKWPNDIYVNNKKIAGILIQNFLLGSNIRHTIIGIGLNVNQEVFPPELHLATSIYIEVGRRVDILITESKLIQELDKNYHLLKEDEDLLRKIYLSRLLGMDEQRRFELSDRTLEGRIVGIDDYGRLKVEEKGIVHTYDHHMIRMIL